MAGGSHTNTTPKFWRTCLLALALIAGCGESASRDDPDAESPSPAAGAGGRQEPTAGQSATAGNGAAPASGGVRTSTGGVTGDAGSGDAGGVTGDAGSGDAGGVTGDAGSQNIGGSAGAGGALALPLPPGCQPQTPTETADLCSLGVACDSSPSVRTYCHRLDSGQWECQCSNQESMYRLENAAGLQACALSARLCTDDELDLGEETCERSSDSSDEDRCFIDFACRKPVASDATSDVRAWQMRFGSARCDAVDASRSFGCTCDDGEAKSYQLHADSSALACGPFADFCMSGESPVFDGPEVCSPSLTSWGSQSCHQTAGCGLQMALTDDVSLVQVRERQASCVPRAGGGSECDCFENDTWFQFYVSAATEAATCASAIANCNPNAVIEPTGPATCEPMSLDTQGAHQCGGFSMCVQPVTVDNRSIEARGNVALLCRRIAAGMPWACSCASASDTARIELGVPGADAFEACTQATAACVEQMGMHIGPAGYTIQPPDPFL
jgi:hypothetical protein